MPLCRGQLLEEEEETPRRDPLCQMGLLFQGEQMVRDGGNPRRRTIFKTPREGVEERSGRRVHSWLQGAGGWGVRLFQQRDPQPVQTPPAPPPVLPCAAKARSRLSCTCLLCLAHGTALARREELISCSLLKPWAPLWCGFLFPVFPVKPSKIKPGCLDLIQKMYQTKSILSRNVLVSISAEVYCSFFSGKAAVQPLS